MTIRLIALRDLDRSTGPLKKGEAFEVENADPAGVETLVAAGYVKRADDPEPPVEA